MQKIIDILRDNNNSIVFEDSLTVKMSPHSYPEKIRKVFLIGDEIFFTNKQGENKAAITDPIKYSILQRLNLLKNYYKKIK